MSHVRKKIFMCLALTVGLLSTGAWAAEPKTPPVKITPAPAFTAQQLNQAPEDDWITNGGSLKNQRYSPLKEINSSNVGQLKGAWLTHLKGSGTAMKYSAEGQPLEHNGVIYVPTGADDVFAVSVETGKILWQYNAKLDNAISTVCCVGSVAVLRWATAKFISVSWMASWSRSISKPAKWPGPRRPQNGKRVIP